MSTSPVDPDNPRFGSPSPRNWEAWVSQQKLWREIEQVRYKRFREWLKTNEPHPDLVAHMERYGKGLLLKR